MGRELKRKEAKKNKKNIKKEVELDTSIKGSTALKIIIFSILILLVLYYIIAVFVTKEIDISGSNNTDQTETTENSVSNKILAKNIFNQKEETYYVYFYDFNEEDNSISSAINSKSDIKIYRVDTSSALNQNYITDDAGNRNVTSLTDLKVKNPTIIEITNDTITAYYEGSSEILSFLG